MNDKVDKNKLTNPYTFHQEWYYHRPNQIDSVLTEEEKNYYNWEDVYEGAMFDMSSFKEEIFDEKNNRHVTLAYNALLQNGLIRPDASREDVIKAFNDYPEGLIGKREKTILYKNKTSQTIVHERSHIFDKFVKQVKFRNKHRNKSVRKDRYLDNDQEIYARLNQFRFNNQLDPTHTYTIEDVQKMRSNPDIIDENIFSRYTDEFILHLLNDVAQHETDSVQNIHHRDPVTMAQIGAKLFLTPHKDYLGTPYKQDGDYFNAHPTNQPTQPGEHWTSRNPTTGQLLKSKNHPTFELMMKGEQEANMNVYHDLNGSLYSYPRDQRVPLYLKQFNFGK